MLELVVGLGIASERPLTKTCCAVYVCVNAEASNVLIAAHEEQTEKGSENVSHTDQKSLASLQSVDISPKKDLGPNTSLVREIASADLCSSQNRES